MNASRGHISFWRLFQSHPIPLSGGYCFRLIDASICCAVTDAGTQFTFSDSSASEKQPLGAPSRFGASCGVKRVDPLNRGQSDSHRA